MRVGRPWVLRIIGLAALLCAALLYEHRGLQTPHDAGFVPSGAALATHVTPPPTPSRNPARPALHTKTSVGRPELPAKLSIATLGVSRAPVLPVTVSDGRLEVPEDPRTVGWWVGGAAPGSLSGPVVIVGHVDSARLGQGALYHLSSLAMGAHVTVGTESGRSLIYRVVGRRVYAKTSLPADVFASSGPPRLVLITCGGPFNRATRHYRDNVVVYAVPTS